MTTGPTPLRWPPPGLEPLHRGLRRILPLWWTGLWAAAAAFAILVGIGSSTLGMFTTPSGSIALALAVVAGLLLGRAVIRLLRLLLSTHRCDRLGYDRDTIVDVIVDLTEEAGSPVEGTGAFERLDPPDRARLGRLRRVAGLTPLLTGALVASASLLVLGLGPSGRIGPAGASLPLAVVIAGGLTTWLLRLPERFIVERWHASRPRSIPEALAPRIADWHRAIGRATPTGPASSARRATPVLSILIVTLAVTLGAATVSIAALWPFGTILSLSFFPQDYELRNAERQLDIALAMRPWALPADSGTTSAEAGAALARLYVGPNMRSRGRQVAGPDTPLPDPPWAGPRGAGIPADVFPAHRFRNQILASIIDSLGRAPTAAERRWMAAVEQAPHWDAVRIVARGSNLDLIAGRVGLPIPDSIPVVPGGLSLPLVDDRPLLALAEANHVRIASRLISGDRAGALLAARELLTLGLRIVEASHSLYEGLVGTVIVASARDQLIRTARALDAPLADAVRDAHVAELERAIPPLQFGVPIEPGWRNEADRSRKAILRVIRGPGPAATRWEALSLVAFLPCTNTRELILGRSADLVDAVAVARTDLLRTAGDSALFERIETVLDRLARAPRRADRGDLFVSSLQAIARGLGNPRLDACLHAIQLKGR